MGYAEFIELDVFNKSTSHTFTIQGASLTWGKFYQYPNKDAEISASQVDNTELKPGARTWVCSCGRDNASSGTEGSIEIWDGITKVGSIAWYDAWAPGATNIVTPYLNGGDASPYEITIGQYSTSGASIGYCEATITHND